MSITKENVLIWVERSLSQGDYLMAERLINKTPQDCERIYAHLMIADIYYETGEIDKARKHQISTVSLWKQFSDEWWVAPILSEMIEGFMKAGQMSLIESVVSYGKIYMNSLASDWLKTHLLCGIAHGLFCLGKNSEANSYIRCALQTAKSRATKDQRMSALTIVKEFLVHNDLGGAHEQYILK